MLFIQLFLLLFFAFAIYKTILRLKAGDIKKSAAFFWIIFWLLAGYVAISPNSTIFAAKFLGLGRGADAVIYVSLALLFFLFFGLTVKMEKMNRAITRLARQNALSEFKKEQEKKP